MTTFDKQSFQEKLDAIHEWPTHYIFKFIVPSDDRAMLQTLLPLGSISERASKNGRYTSITLSCWMTSSQAVLAVYEKVAQLKQVIAL